jgi:hypothetical protein
VKSKPETKPLTFKNKQVALVALVPIRLPSLKRVRKKPKLNNAKKSVIHLSVKNHLISWPNDGEKANYLRL